MSDLRFRLSHFDWELNNYNELAAENCLIREDFELDLFLEAKLRAEQIFVMKSHNDLDEIDENKQNDDNEENEESQELKKAGRRPLGLGLSKRKFQVMRNLLRKIKREYKAKFEEITQYSK